MENGGGGREEEVNTQVPLFPSLMTSVHPTRFFKIDPVPVILTLTPELALRREV